MAFLSNRVHGVYHAFMKIVTEGGIRGLWAGWVPNVQRAALVNLGGMNEVQRDGNLLTAALNCFISYSQT